MCSRGPRERKGSNVRKTIGSDHFTVWSLHVAHAGIFAAAMILAFLLRFDFKVSADEGSHLWTGVALAVLVKVSVFFLLRIHRLGWRYAGVTDIVSILMANLWSSLVLTTVLFALFGRGFPRSVYLLDLMICFMATGALRLAARLYLEMSSSQYQGAIKHILIYGAGDTGVALLREIKSNPQLGYKVVGFLDDLEDRRTLSILGVPVLGAGRNVVALLGKGPDTHIKVDEIVIAMPAADNRQMAEAMANCRAAGIACKTVPGLGEFLVGRSLSTQIRDVPVDDLLGREPVDIDDVRVREMIMGTAVLVTGAAGSIGSELCRQVACKKPKVLVVLDQAESELFQLEIDLRAEFPNVDLVAVLGDIRDRDAIAEVLQTYRIATVYHAAAYKHVPIVERYPFEAIRNNVLGTWSLANAAYDNGVSTFLMISSDKAVNPSSMMGATKRAAEILLSGMPSDRTRFVSVRFGNVLGSNGSVIPLFQKQISAGGPVTITHPAMKRYFMTISEAVQLSLNASTMGRRNEVFVLDMGQPVSIVDLAKQMIRLSGLEPDKDIEIRYTGTRPGEKLFEELVVGGEMMAPTDHRKIWVLTGALAIGSENRIWLTRLNRLLETRDVEGLRAHMRKLIPEFRTPAEEPAVVGIFEDTSKRRIRPVTA